ncbi:hypothetical protein O9992_03010 [Vibrio lentus]|nr:hypothetical protein [Vibrio lentus]
MGKSTTSVNLALALSKSGSKVGLLMRISMVRLCL